jgi:meso-butanediol dehydrogenase / (S,S)-butanediol dehydrogenase / diacetyl reductase
MDFAAEGNRREGRIGPMRLAGKCAVVTGGGSGIGAATARLFAAEGARVAVLDRDLPHADQIAGEIRDAGGKVLALACDVAKEEQIRECVGKVADSFGPIDVLFTSAGTAFRRSVSETEAGDWDRLMEINLRGPYLCAKFCLQHFRPEGGSIIHVSSVTGITGVRSRAAYSASKGALVALTRNMAMDLASRKIRVNCVCPGFVRTAMAQPLLSDPVRHERLVSMHPLGRLGEPEDIAQAVLFLASEESSWMTGASLVVDGGFSAGKSEDV